MNIFEPTRIKVVDIGHAFFLREMHELNSKILNEFNLKELPSRDDLATFILVAKKDNALFNFILIKDDDCLQRLFNLMTPRMLKNTAVYKAQCFGLWTKPTKEDEYINIKNLIPIKIEIHDEPFFLYSTYDSTKTIF